MSHIRLSAWSARAVHTLRAGVMKRVFLVEESSSSSSNFYVESVLTDLKVVLRRLTSDLFFS